MEPQPLTLKELIDECGFAFRSLSYHSPRTSEGPRYWIVKGRVNKTEPWQLFKGYTPEQAVTKLLFALKPITFVVDTTPPIPLPEEEGVDS
jgi:hypothetical protein